MHEILSEHGAEVIRFVLGVERDRDLTHPQRSGYNDLPGEHMLFAAMIRQAIRDRDAWLYSAECEVLCELIGWNEHIIETLRRPETRTRVCARRVNLHRYNNGTKIKRETHADPTCVTDRPSDAETLGTAL